MSITVKLIDAIATKPGLILWQLKAHRFPEVAIKLVIPTRVPLAFVPSTSRGVLLGDISVKKVCFSARFLHEEELEAP